MIDDSTKKAIFRNAVLIANADGQVEATESAFLREFLNRAGVSPEQAAAWHAEVRAGDDSFAQVGDRAQALQMLEILTGVAAADGKLDESEWHALLHIAKAADIPYAEVRDLVQAAWGQDVLAKLDAPAPAPAAAAVEPRYKALAVQDHFDKLDHFVQCAPAVSFHVCPLAEVGAGAPPWAIFHTAEQRKGSLQVLAYLQQCLPETRIIAVVRRDQAPQVSYVLQAGACRCIIEDVHPGEFERLLQKVEANEQ